VLTLICAVDGGPSHGLTPAMAARTRSHLSWTPPQRGFQSHRMAASRRDFPDVAAFAAGLVVSGGLPLGQLRRTSLLRPSARQVNFPNGEGHLVLALNPPHHVRR
jgi:hypothetical protein